MRRDHKIWIICLLGITTYFPINASGNNYYQELGYYEVGSWVPVGNSPQILCKQYASVWKWDINGYSAKTIQVSGGTWKCQRYYLGSLEPSQYTYIFPQCQLNPAPISGTDRSHPYADKTNGGCYCQSQSPPKYFDAEVEWCTANPSTPPGGTAFVRNGKWVANDPPKEQGGLCTASQKVQGNPINIAVGNKYQSEVDFAASGQYPLTVSRSYNSMSQSWSFFNSFETIELIGPYDEVVMARSDGRRITFSPDGTGGWLPDTDIKEKLESFDDGAGNIISWHYTTLNDEVEEYNATGRLTKSTNRMGLSHTFAYASNSITVSSGFSHNIVFSLDTEGTITGFTDSDGNSYSYSYDLNKNLINVSYPNSGGTRTYHYENANFPRALTGITDETGNRFATWAYDSTGRATSSQHANGAELVTLDYTHIDDTTDPRVTATNELGKQTTYHYTTIHGVRKITQVEGHQSTNCAAANQSYTYDVNGFKDLVTDWEGNVTDYDHDTRGLEVQRIEAKGTLQQRVITTEWHADFRLPTKITEPDRVIEFSYDAQGLLLKRKETPVP